MESTRGACNRPQWQRAQVKEGDTEQERAVIGKRCWVAIGYPRPGADYPSYPTNIVHPLIGKMSVNTRIVELLPEFADDVPLVSWEDFVK